MVELITQPSNAPTRKVAAGAVAGSIGGPVVAWAAMQWLGYSLDPECAGQISELLLYGITAVGGMLAGVVGYLVRERAPRGTA